MSEPEPIILRSPANATVRHLVRMRDNRARRKAGRVIVDGWRETGQALAAGLVPCGIYFAESQWHRGVGNHQDPSYQVRSDPAAAGKITLVTDAILEKISYGQSARGVVAEFEQPQLRLDQLQLPPSPLLLVLDKIEKPGNIGAVFRCADAAGVDAVLLCDSQDLFNPNAIRSSLGSVFHVPAAGGSEQQIAAFLIQQNIRVLAARVESSTSLWSTDLTGPLAIVLGSEADGLRDRWLTMGDRPIAGVRIPMAGKIDSLNISVSAAVLAFEAVRMRQS